MFWRSAPPPGRGFTEGEGRVFYDPEFVGQHLYALSLPSPVRYTVVLIAVFRHEQQ